MFGLILGATARIHYALRGLMPTNVLLDALHTRRGLKWGVPAMLLAVPYALAAVFCAGRAGAGGSGLFNLLALVFACYAVLVIMPMMASGAVRGTGAEGWLSA